MLQLDEMNDNDFDDESNDTVDTNELIEHVLDVMIDSTEFLDNPVNPIKLILMTSKRKLNSGILRWCAILWEKIHLLM